MKRCWFHTISKRRQIEAGRQRDEEESQRAAQESRFEAAAETQEGDIERAARDFGQREIAAASRAP